MHVKATFQKIVKNSNNRIEIKHFLFLLYYSTNLHVIYFFKTYFES